MAGITLAFVHLNRAFADAGASYAWVGRILHRDLGFLCGWTVLVTSVLFTVSATIPAATATLLLVAPGRADEKQAVIGVAAAWIVAITLLEVRGVRQAAIVQTVMTAIEIAVLAGILVLASFRFGPEIGTLLSSISLAPSSFSLETFAAGAVIAVFFFWGWDVTLNASEETRNAHRVPGVAAMISMAIIALAFMAFMLVALAILGEPGIQSAGANVIFAIADRLLPRPWSYVAVLAVMLSSVGSLQVSLLQFARTLFAQSRAGEMHPRWARLHERWQTPHLATWLNGALGVALLLLALLLPSIDDLLKASINAIGLEIAFYYGLAAIACAWHFRKTAFRSPVLLFTAVVWPMSSALALWVTAGLTACDMDAFTLSVGIGALLVGVVPMALRYRLLRN